MHPAKDASFVDIVCQQETNTLDVEILMIRFRMIISKPCNPV